ncbi:MAG: hypothetical protein WAU23_09210 [Ferruginibacter sp.]
MDESNFLALPAGEQLVREKRSIITINAASDRGLKESRDMHFVQ